MLDTESQPNIRFFDLSNLTKCHPPYCKPPTVQCVVAGNSGASRRAAAPRSEARETVRPIKRWLPLRSPLARGITGRPGLASASLRSGHAGRAGCGRRFCRHALRGGAVARGFIKQHMRVVGHKCLPDTTFALAGCGKSSFGGVFAFLKLPF